MLTPVIQARRRDVGVAEELADGDDVAARAAISQPYVPAPGW